MDAQNLDTAVVKKSIGERWEEIEKLFDGAVDSNGAWHRPYDINKVTPIHVAKAILMEMRLITREITECCIKWNKQKNKEERVKKDKGNKKDNYGELQTRAQTIEYKTVEYARAVLKKVTTEENKVTGRWGEIEYCESLYAAFKCVLRDAETFLSNIEQNWPSMVKDISYMRFNLLTSELSVYIFKAEIDEYKTWLQEQSSALQHGTEGTGCRVRGQFSTGANMYRNGVRKRVEAYVREHGLENGFF